MDRLSFLKQAFGEHASKFEDNLNKIAQNNFEACKCGSLFLLAQV